MRIGKNLIVPAVWLTALTVFGQGTNNIGKSVDELKKDISLGTVNCSEYRDTKNNDQKMALVKATSEQDQDMGFDGAMRCTVELTGNDGEVWYGQIVKPQGAKKVGYTGTDLWEFRFSHGALKYPQMAYALEYGYEMPDKTFVAVDQKFKKAESADEIMDRNKGSANKLKITAKAVAEREGAAAAAE
jgi:hypothetical protein